MTVITLRKCMLCGHKAIQDFRSLCEKCGDMTIGIKQADMTEEDWRIWNEYHKSL